MVFQNSFEAFHVRTKFHPTRVDLIMDNRTPKWTAVKEFILQIEI